MAIIVMTIVIVFPVKSDIAVILCPTVGDKKQTHKNLCTIMSTNFYFNVNSLLPAEIKISKIMIVEMKRNTQYSCYNMATLITTLFQTLCTCEFHF